jgi:hypothetical protein
MIEHSVKLIGIELLNARHLMPGNLQIATEQQPGTKMQVRMDLPLSQRINVCMYKHMRGVTPKSTSRAPVFSATPVSCSRSKILRNEVRTQSPRAGATEARKKIVPTHNTTQDALGRVMTFRLGFCEIIKPRKCCRGGSGGGFRQVLGSTGRDTTRVDAFCVSPEGLRLRSVRSSIAR